MSKPNDRQPLSPAQVAAQQAKWPPWLQLTPEQQADDAALQIRLSSIGARAHPSREEAHLLRAAALEHHAVTQLRSEHASDDKIEQARRTLADAYAMRGDFEHAAATHPDPEQAERYSKIAIAVERPDDEKCEHVTAEHDVNGKKIEVHPRIVSEMIYSKKHGKMVPIIKCVKCGHENARAAGPRTAERQNKVRAAMREAHGR